MERKGGKPTVPFLDTDPNILPSDVKDARPSIPNEHIVPKGSSHKLIDRPLQPEGDQSPNTFG